MLSIFISHLKTQPLGFVLVSILGFLTVLKFSLNLLKLFYKSFLRKPKNLKQNYGSWALITGATDGIGKAFAYELAKQGLNLILVSRNIKKLKTVSQEIQENFRTTKIKILSLDFSSEDQLNRVQEMIEEAMKGVDVGVLINNVGITYPKARFFDEVDEEIWMSIVRVNLEGTSRVTRAVVGGMIERRKGAIVNIGSGASIVVPSHPLYTIYAATKAYIDRLSRCLYVEYKSRGIDVQCQVPLYVATNMTSRVASIERSSLFIASPQDYAQAAIRHIGYEPRCTPYWPHSLQWFFARLLPESLLDSWRLSIGIAIRNSTILEVKFRKILSFRLP